MFCNCGIAAIFACSSNAEHTLCLTFNGQIDNDKERLNSPLSFYAV